MTVRYTIRVNYPAGLGIGTSLVGFIQRCGATSGMVGGGRAGMAFRAVETRDAALEDLRRLLDPFDVTITPGETR